MRKNNTRHLDFSVGIFLVLGLLAFIVMALKVSDLSVIFPVKTYTVTASFTDIGGLKVRAPVTISGVKVGEVTRIELQPEQLNAKVTLALYANQPIPFEDVSARILTQGLLGSNYISILPGFEDESSDHKFLAQGDVIAKTQEAMILENLIGQLLFNVKK